MLNVYLNQTALYRLCSGTDGRGQPIFGKAKFVKCRRQSKIQNVLTATGQSVQTQYIYFLTQKVEVGDMLDGRGIMGIAEWVGLNGSVIGYKAVV